MPFDVAKADPALRDWVRSIHHGIETWFPLPEITTISHELRVLYWKAIEMERRRVEARWLPSFVRAMEEALRQASQVARDDLGSLPEKGAKILSGILRPLIWEAYRATSEAFYHRIEESVREKARLVNPMDVPYIRQALEYQLAEKITRIDQASKAHIRNLLIGHFTQADLNVENVIKDLADSYAFSRRRGEVIGRTEITYMSNAATHYSVEINMAVDEMTKDWLATNDARTRPTHSSADATQRNIPFHKPFEVGGSKLMFPGDSSLGAPGRETIQCRCTTLYNRPRRPRQLQPEPEPETVPKPSPAAPARPKPKPKPKPGRNVFRDKLWERDPEAYYEEVKRHGKRIMDEWLVELSRRPFQEPDLLKRYTTLVEDLSKAIQSGSQPSITEARDRLVGFIQESFKWRHDSLKALQKVLDKMETEGQPVSVRLAGWRGTKKAQRENLDKFEDVLSRILLSEKRESIQIKLKIVPQDRRPYALPDLREVYISPNMLDLPWNRVVAHEIGHVLERELPHLRAAMMHHLEMRTLGEEAVPLRRFSPLYREDEMAKPDKFEDPYVGKMYPGGYTEVLSMTIEALFDRGRMANVIANDRETFELVLGALFYGRRLP